MPASSAAPNSSQQKLFGHRTVSSHPFLAAALTPTPTITSTPTRTPTPPGGFSGIVHYHLDHLGSVHVITNPDGSVFEYIRYRPYGEPRGHYDANGNQQPTNTCSDDGYCREFTGYDSEPVSGLEYAGARFYDPALGMFVTHDPARQFASPYAYGPWNPVNGTDPTGTIFGIDDAIFWGVVIAGVLAGAAASGIQAAVNGASIGDAFKAAAIGAAIGGVSAPIGAFILQPALGVAIGALTGLSVSTASDVATAVLFTSSLAQASYGISQNDYSGIIGLGVAIGTGYAFARPQGANGAAADPDDPLRFSRNGLQRVDKNGNVLGDFGGVSGNGELRSDTPGLDFSQATQVPNQGPIPEGNYVVDPRNIQSFSDLSASQHLASWESVITRDQSTPWHFGPPAWGYERVPIQPLAGTNTFGRGGFFIHGGWFPGSSGCIDLTGNASAFFGWLRQQPGPVPLSVGY